MSCEIAGDVLRYIHSSSVVVSTNHLKIWIAIADDELLGIAKVSNRLLIKCEFFIINSCWLQSLYTRNLCLHTIINKCLCVCVCLCMRVAEGKLKLIRAFSQIVVHAIKLIFNWIQHKLSGIHCQRQARINYVCFSLYLSLFLSVFVRVCTRI